MVLRTAFQNLATSVLVLFLWQHHAIVFSTSLAVQKTFSLTCNHRLQTLAVSSLENILLVKGTSTVYKFNSSLVEISRTQLHSEHCSSAEKKIVTSQAQEKLDLEIRCLNITHLNVKDVLDFEGGLNVITCFKQEQNTTDQLYCLASKQQAAENETNVLLRIGPNDRVSNIVQVALSSSVEFEPDDAIIGDFNVEQWSCFIRASIILNSSRLLCLKVGDTVSDVINVPLSCGSGTVAVSGSLSRGDTQKSQTVLVLFENGNTALLCEYNISEVLNGVSSCSGTTNNTRKLNCPVINPPVFGPTQIARADDILVTWQNNIRVLFTINSGGQLKKIRGCMYPPEVCPVATIPEDWKQIKKTFRFQLDTDSSPKLLLSHNLDLAAGEIKPSLTLFREDLLILSSEKVILFDIRGCKGGISTNDCLTVVLDVSQYPPALISYKPWVALLSDETNITIDVTNVTHDVVTNVTIGNQQCNILSITHEKVICKVAQTDRAENRSYLLPVHVDFQTGRNADLFPLFTLIPVKPVIHSITPDYSIFSGGLTVTIEGTNLEWLGGLSSRLSYANIPINQTYDSELRWMPTGQLEGKTPVVSSANNDLTVNLQLEISEQDTPQYGILLLNRTLHLKPDPLKPSLVPNVTALILNDDINQLENDTLIIRGERLDSVPMEEIKVTTRRGKGQCTIINRTSSEILCKAEVPSFWFRCAMTVDVTIHFGKNLAYKIGELSYRCLEETSDTQQITVTLVDEDTTVKIVVPLIIVAVLLLVAVIFLAVFRKRFCKENSRRFSNDMLLARFRSNSTRRYQRADSNPGHMEDGAPGGGASASLLKEEPSYRDCLKAVRKDAEILIPAKHLQVGEVIGQGHFGCVRIGELTIRNKTHVKVAVKSLHQCGDHFDKVASAFLREGMIMKGLEHDHVVHMHGICIDKEAMPVVVLAYMEHGDLQTYVRNEHNVPTVKELVTFGLHVAKGMEYLSEVKVVHRDLAARNCMVDAELCVKVADFGLSRDVYESAYYAANRNKHAMLPVKWMAPECITKGIFNEQTDVWSYGVLLWELLTRGHTPYGDVGNWDIGRYIATGRRLEQPAFCPAELYGLMRKCWSEIPQRRPSFREIRVEIETLLQEAEHLLGNADEPSNIEKLYVNVDPEGFLDQDGFDLDDNLHDPLEDDSLCAKGDV